MSEIHYDTGKLYGIDVNSGATAYIADTGIIRPACLAKAPNNEYYTFSSGTNSKLYRVNVTTGGTTLVGSLGLSFTFEGGLAFDGAGNAYATNGGEADDPKLLRINLATGAATVIARIGMSAAYDVNGLIWDSDSGLLVGIDREANNLVYISPISGSIGLRSNV